MNVGVHSGAMQHLTRSTTQLFHDRTMSLISHCQAAIVLVGSDAEEASLAHLLPHIVREFIGVVDGLCNILGDFPSCKLDSPLPQLLQIVLSWRGKSLWVFGRSIPLLIPLRCEEASVRGGYAGCPST